MKAAFIVRKTHSGRKLQHRQAHSMLTEGMISHPLRRPRRPRRLQAFILFLRWTHYLHDSMKAKIP